MQKDKVNKRIKRLIIAIKPLAKISQHSQPLIPNQLTPAAIILPFPLPLTALTSRPLSTERLLPVLSVTHLAINPAAGLDQTAPALTKTNQKLRQAKPPNRLYYSRKVNRSIDIAPIREEDEHFY
jgi:hypothetical protein